LKVPAKQAKNPDEHLCLDVSSPKTTSIGGKKHWLLVVDDCMDYA